MPGGAMAKELDLEVNKPDGEYPPVFRSGKDLFGPRLCW